MTRTWSAFKNEQANSNACQFLPRQLLALLTRICWGTNLASSRSDIRVFPTYRRHHIDHATNYRPEQAATTTTTTAVDFGVKIIIFSGFGQDVQTVAHVIGFRGFRKFLDFGLPYVHDLRQIACQGHDRGHLWYHRLTETDTITKNHLLRGMRWPST